MLFNSLSFLVFFPLVAVSYFVVPSRFQIVLLLLASCVFYMAFVPSYIFIMLGLIALDFTLAPFMERATGRARRVFLAASIAANLGILFLFKYFNFFNANVAALAHLVHWNYDPVLLALALPLGLSFHVFQSLSYVIEVYKGNWHAERDFFAYALYVLFFPQLVAGPIERPAHLLPQIHAVHTFDAIRARRGLERMLWGFFKKLVIADNAAVLVNHVYGSLQASAGPALLIMVLLFSYQLYCDFSGYSDIAIGAALILGFELTENFDRPYAARSIAEFWRRWHISLSSWLRDYLYYPLALGSGAKTPLRLYASLLVTFTLIGLWHGANWTYVAMGALFGVYLVVESATGKFRKNMNERMVIARFPRLHHALQVSATCALVAVGWVFFRSENMKDAWFILTHLFSGLGSLLSFRYIRYELLTVTAIGVSKAALAGIIVSIIVLETVQYFSVRGYSLSRWPRWGRWSAYYAVTLAILIWGHFGRQPFIYFKF